MNPRADEKLIVVPYQPGFHLKRRLMAWLAILLGIAGGVAVGWYIGSKQILQIKKEDSQLLQQLADAEQREETLVRQIASLERGRAIDSAANRDVQTTIRDLESTVVQLKEDVAFYKNIMAPGTKDDKGLKIQKLELRPAKDKDDGDYHYKLVLTQVADNSSYISGLVAVNLIGMRGESKEILPLRDVEGAKDLGQKFRFRYFQDIEGDLTLPDGFEASQIHVVAQATGKKATKVERTFDWKLEE